MIAYALVSKGSFILAEYTPHDGDFPELARKILLKSQHTREKRSLIRDDYTFTFFSEKEFTFLCMTKSQVAREVSYKFLDEMSNSFFVKQSRSANDPKESMSAQFTVVIKDLIVMNYTKT